MDADKPQNIKQWIIMPFSHVLFALFTVFLFSAPIIDGVEFLLRTPLSEETRLAISAAVALSAKSVILLVKDGTPAAISALVNKIFSKK